MASLPHGHGFALRLDRAVGLQVLLRAKQSPEDCLCLISLRRGCSPEPPRCAGKDLVGSRVALGFREALNGNAIIQFTVWL